MVPVGRSEGRSKQQSMSGGGRKERPRQEGKEKKRKAGFLIFSEFHFPLLLKDGTRVPLKIIKRHP